jgi:nitroimidazol reductase NimA-like FMN-containing flavoprotein (pyridoxamine 5'-phosphate oxidase superfamily)
MRRKDREITEESHLEAILRSAAVCRLALTDGAQPYLVPMSFGFADGALYLHSAPAGRKIDLLRRNDRVCFEVEADVALVMGELACGWSFNYRSVIGFGRACFVDDAAERRRGLDAIMRQYGSVGPQDYAEQILARTLVIRIDIERLTGKERQE